MIVLTAVVQSRSTQHVSECWPSSCLTLTRRKWQDASSPSKIFSKEQRTCTRPDMTRFAASIFHEPLAPWINEPRIPTKFYFSLPSAFLPHDAPNPFFPSSLHKHTHTGTKWQPSPIHLTLTRSRSWRSAQPTGYKRNHSTTDFHCSKLCDKHNNN